jgi:hypothetical protein
MADVVGKQLQLEPGLNAHFRELAWSRAFYRP